MTYRCLIHKPSASYSGQIVGNVSDWKGLAKEADSWAIAEVELEPSGNDFEVEIYSGLSVKASQIDATLLCGVL